MQTYKEEDIGHALVMRWSCVGHALVINVDDKRVVWVCVSSGGDGKVLQW
jgi:hypothetical protein